MPQINFDAWPTWLIFILLALNLFREQISSFVPTAIRDHFSHRARRMADREEHVQEIEETLLNNRMQTMATEQLRSSWREEQWVELLQRKDAWLIDQLDKRLLDLQASTDKLLEEQIKMRYGINRTNDILTTIHITLSKLVEQNTPGAHREQ